jgi:hypothetical protein
VYKVNENTGKLTIDGDLDAESLEKPFFKVFSRAGSGHPSDYTYGWVRNDASNLYIATDFVPDNTIDGDKDYSSVFVNTPGGVKEFRASVPEQQWENPGFTYTAKAACVTQMVFLLPINFL